MKRSCVILLLLYFRILSAQTDQLTETTDSSAVSDTVRFSAVSDTLTGSDTLKSYSLSISSNLDFAKIYSDTQFIGLTPLKDYILKEGNYKLKIINPKSLQDWQNDNQTIDLFINKDTTVNIIFKYFYYINTTPYSAKVFKEDSLIGETPLRFFRENELTGNLLIRRKNYKDYFFDLSGYNYGTGANIKLNPKGLEEVNDLVYKDRSTQFNTKRSLMPILGTGAVSIASAIMAFNYKNIANDEYDRYLLFGNEERLQESKNNDTYFAVSIVVMQAAVAGLIYFLFFDK